MAVFPTQGSYPLTSVDKLPNVTVAFPGEHWSNRIAVGPITPGAAIVPVNSSGKLGMQVAVAADPVEQMAIALRTIDVPDVNPGSLYNPALGPNEIKNLQINNGDYVHAYYSGSFHLTLIVPRAWVPGELVSWHGAGARPTGKTGTGAWNVAGASGTNPDPLFEVMEFRPYSSNGHEGVLTVRSLRGQF